MPDGNKTLEEQKKEFLDEALKANKQDKKEVGMAKKKVNSELSPLSLEPEKTIRSTIQIL